MIRSWYDEVFLGSQHQHMLVRLLVWSFWKTTSNRNLIISLTSKGTGQTTVFFSVVMLSVFFKGFDQAESSDIHGFVGHAWDVKCPSILRLWISDVKTRCDFLRDDVGQFVRTTSLWPNHSIIVILLGSLLL